MSIFLTSFFISLFGIIAIIGRKLILLKNKEMVHEHDFAIEVPDLEDIKEKTHKSIKKYSYILLFVTLRIYILSLNILKRKYNILKDKIQARLGNKRNNFEEVIKENKEASKFLKMMSEYKSKIRRIKHRIKEEEGLN